MPKVKEPTATFSLPEAIPDRQDDPKLATLRERLRGLQNRRDIERQRREAILKQLNNLHGSLLDQLAEALIDDPTASMGANSAREELQHVDRVLDGIRLAIPRLEHDVMQAEATRDAEACRSVAGRHRSNVRTTLNHAWSLHRATVAQQALREQLSLGGVERTGWLVPHFPIDFAGDPTDGNSFMAFYLKEAVELKFMTQDERLQLLEGRLTELDVNT